MAPPGTKPHTDPYSAQYTVYSRKGRGVTTISTQAPSNAAPAIAMPVPQPGYGSSLTPAQLPSLSQRPSPSPSPNLRPTNANTLPPQPTPSPQPGDGEQKERFLPALAAPLAGTLGRLALGAGARIGANALIRNGLGKLVNAFGNNDDKPQPYSYSQQAPGMGYPPPGGMSFPPPGGMGYPAPGAMGYPPPGGMGYAPPGMGYVPPMGYGPSGSGGGSMLDPSLIGAGALGLGAGAAAYGVAPAVATDPYANVVIDGITGQVIDGAGVLPVGFQTVGSALNPFIGGGVDPGLLATEASLGAAQQAEAIGYLEGVSAATAATEQTVAAAETIGYLEGLSSALAWL